MVAIKARSCLVSSWRISHLGMKPVRGGRPPRERRIIGDMDVRVGALVHDVASILIVVVLFSLKVRNIERVIIRYVRSVSRVREGASCRTKIIQPRWAMEE